MNMNQLITEQIKAVHERRKKLEDTLESLENSISEVKDGLVKLEGAMEVLVELKATVEPKSVEPRIGEDDIKEFMDMLHILRNFENIRNNKEKREEWMAEFGISNKDFDLILSLAPLFLGNEDGITSYEDIATSVFPHANNFLYSSKENIDGHDISYSGYRTLIKDISTSSVFQPLPEMKDAAVAFELQAIISDILLSVSLG